MEVSRKARPLTSSLFLRLLCSRWERVGRTRGCLCVFEVVSEGFLEEGTPKQDVRDEQEFDKRRQKGQQPWPGSEARMFEEPETVSAWPPQQDPGALPESSPSLSGNLAQAQREPGSAGTREGRVVLVTCRTWTTPGTLMESAAHVTPTWELGQLPPCWQGQRGTSSHLLTGTAVCGCS